LFPCVVDLLLLLLLCAFAGGTFLKEVLFFRLGRGLYCDTHGGRTSFWYALRKLLHITQGTPAQVSFQSVEGVLEMMGASSWSSTGRMACVEIGGWKKGKKPVHHRLSAFLLSGCKNSSTDRDFDVVCAHDPLLSSVIDSLDVIKGGDGRLSNNIGSTSDYLAQAKQAKAPQPRKQWQCALTQLDHSSHSLLLSTMIKSPEHHVKA
jgi:hypothetical protein